MDIDGKGVAKEWRDKIRDEIINCDYRPCLAFILVGNDLPSKTYVRMKERACAEVGVLSKPLYFSEDISELNLLKNINILNNDDTIHGILVQMPLPNHINSQKIINNIDPNKDVDGFHPTNVGKMVIGEDDCFISCTPFGIIKLLEAYQINTKGKHVVIIGRSNIVGKPLANLLIQKNDKYGNATVTVAHSYTEDLTKICKTGDILIAAIGKPNAITIDMVKSGAVVIDVGINYVQNKIVGDVDYDNVSKICSLITPVPGGVGPMTIAALLHNTLQSCKKKFLNFLHN